MSLFFNFSVGMFSFILPQAYSTMFPKEIKEAAAPYVVKKDVHNKKDIVKGAESCRAWELKGWMKSALPEHLIVWELTFCPVAGLIVAGIVKLFQSTL